jgi:hypothetical protein
MLRTRTSYASGSEVLPETQVETTPATPPAPANGGHARRAEDALVTPVTNLVERITGFNEGREPERLQYKYARMRASAFGFYRGTSHLFYQDWPRASKLDRTPATWVSGDLHLENFGSYRSDSQQVHFDLGDFDESALGPAAWDLARFATSVLLGARSLGMGGREATGLIQHFIRCYAASLRDGKARWIERQSTKGIVRDLINDLRNRSQRELLDSRTEFNGKARRLLIDRKHTLPVPEVARGSRIPRSSSCSMWFGASPESPTWASPATSCWWKVMARPTGTGFSTSSWPRTRYSRHISGFRSRPGRTRRSGWSPSRTECRR